MAGGAACQPPRLPLLGGLLFGGPFALAHRRGQAARRGGRRRGGGRAAHAVAAAAALVGLCAARGVGVQPAPARAGAVEQRDGRSGRHRPHRARRLPAGVGGGAARLGGKRDVDHAAVPLGARRAVWPRRRRAEGGAGHAAAASRPGGGGSGGSGAAIRGAGQGERHFAQRTALGSPAAALGPARPAAGVCGARLPVDEIGPRVGAAGGRIGRGGDGASAGGREANQRGGRGCRAGGGHVVGRSGGAVVCGAREVAARGARPLRRVPRPDLCHQAPNSAGAGPGKDARDERAVARAAGQRQSGDGGDDGAVRAGGDGRVGENGRGRRVDGVSGRRSGLGSGGGLGRAGGRWWRIRAVHAVYNLQPVRFVVPSSRRPFSTASTGRPRPRLLVQS
mmetsp:Transcript_22985/g.67726  ORF Transcript_22985/g.67726 Transcript_22985/m.67726 type:complete len:393 (-) Transcript_22985:225-1403(-)